MVQNLIERCLLLHMDREQCVKALDEHAKIQPLVTLTVWKELMKENKHFFQSYFRSISPRTYTSKKNKKFKFLCFIKYIWTLEL
ncbi:hypothetical protein PHJA_001890500 [Phtheirospermum japonicum]|uniref:Angiotensin-converting enzyme 2 n=1 Tax=Phtheirospermum japonicum TaxID=374723 RepID=A0A830CML4_9LAMI|nr:hypothetical protein PHJA_001890500 [Phtheirospermum japonicum]